MTAPMNLREYFAAIGSPYTKADADVIGPQIEALAEEGDVSPERVRDVARSKNSPLHPYIEWDKDVAADRWQLHQASTMLRSIRVRVIEDGRAKTAPAYRIEKTQPRGALAKGHNVLRGDSAAAVQKAKEAFDELVGWRARYGPFALVWADFALAFRGVMNQVGEAEDVVRTATIDDRTDDALTELLACLAPLVSWRERHAAIADGWETISEQAGFLVEAIDDAASVYGDTLKTKTRPCLRCSRSFESTGPSNRLCPRCSGLTAVTTSRIG